MDQSRDLIKRASGDSVVCASIGEDALANLRRKRNEGAHGAPMDLAYDSTRTRHALSAWSECYAVIISVNMCQGGSPWIWRSLLNPSCRNNGIIYIFRAIGSVAERTNKEIALIM